MTTISEDFRADAEFLREVTDKNIIAQDIRERLFQIADNVRMMSNAMFVPSLQLEKRIEERLTLLVEQDLVGKAHCDPIVLALWLIQRRLASAGTKSLIGGGLSALGLGALAKTLVPDDASASASDMPEGAGRNEGGRDE